jgi:hypothetical protein
MDFEKTFPNRFYLNLARRQDRRTLAEDQFRSIALRVERFPAVDACWVKELRGHDTKARYALALTTRLLLRRMIQQKATSVLIFEDDVVLAPDFVERVETLELPEDWGMFYLGAQHHIRPVAVGRGLVRVGLALDAQAFAINGRYLHKVYRALEQGGKRTFPGSIQISDFIYATLHAEIPTYAAFPNLAWQGIEESDVQGKNYSNYGITGDQLPAPEIMRGVAAEVLGIRALPRANEIRGSHFLDTVTRLFPRWEFPKFANQTFLPDLPSQTKPSVRKGVIIRTGSAEEIAANRCAWSEWHNGYTDSLEVLELLLDSNPWENLHRRLNAARKVMIDFDLLGLAFIPAAALPLRSPKELCKMWVSFGPGMMEWKSIFSNSGAKVTKRLPIEVWDELSKIGYRTDFFPAAWAENSEAMILTATQAAALCEDDLTEFLQWTASDPWTIYPASILRLKGAIMDRELLRKNPVYIPKEDFSKEELIGHALASGSFFYVMPQPTTSYVIASQPVIES